MPGRFKDWRKEKQEKYHANFDRRALWRKKRVKFTCEHCGAKQGEERLNKQGEPYKVVVAAAHVNHDPHKRDAKLIILCSACHGRFDGPDHGAKAHRTWERKKRDAQIASGQLVGRWWNGKKIAQF